MKNSQNEISCFFQHKINNYPNIRFLNSNLVKVKVLEYTCCCYFNGIIKINELSSNKTTEIEIQNVPSCGRFFGYKDSIILLMCWNNQVMVYSFDPKNPVMKLEKMRVFKTSNESCIISVDVNVHNDIIFIILSHMNGFLSFLFGKSPKSLLQAGLDLKISGLQSCFVLPKIKESKDKKMKQIMKFHETHPIIQVALVIHEKTGGGDLFSKSKSEIKLIVPCIFWKNQIVIFIYNQLNDKMVLDKTTAMTSESKAIHKMKVFQIFEKPLMVGSTTNLLAIVCSGKGLIEVYFLKNEEHMKFILVGNNADNTFLETLLLHCVKDGKNEYLLLFAVDIFGYTWGCSLNTKVFENNKTVTKKMKRLNTKLKNMCVGIIFSQNDQKIYYIDKFDNKDIKKFPNSV